MKSRGDGFGGGGPDVKWRCGIENAGGRGIEDAALVDREQTKSDACVCGGQSVHTIQLSSRCRPIHSLGLFGGELGCRDQRPG